MVIRAVIVEKDSRGGGPGGPGNLVPRKMVRPSAVGRATELCPALTETFKSL